ncbi:hypothetical protein MKJ01_10645 [Chryseobacterium sp. SSA4.19]|uniref:hypothetical protein n=1 Tax=Chryseobacterium sp. SSA4.19 TaxID=2919915 RepID=UPI001F4E48D9|nr:hypothetical protein [Chryseobacterium sp. SSA4.19]MCJ8154217.1 hypothetical protein [Chryseobacterium sp. SSA4.19]
MKRFFKVVLIVLAIFFGIIAAIIIAWNVSSCQRKKKADEDSITFSKKCDSLLSITEQPEIGFSDFSYKEISTLRFQILRNNKLIEDSVIKTHFKDNSLMRVKIPYREFLKTDTIVVTTPNNLKYYISGYQHVANLHYGMMGYVGSHDCSLSESCIINKSETDGVISKTHAWLESEKENRIKIISPQSEEYEEISKRSKINKDKASNIFQNNRKNEHLMSEIMCGMEVRLDGTFYIFMEEREDSRKKDVIKINTETGSFKRYTDYPFH